MYDANSIKSGVGILNYCKQLGLSFYESENEITLSKLDWSFAELPSLRYAITISKEYRVNYYKNYTKVSVRKLFGFSAKLERYSQLKNIITIIGSDESELQPKNFAISQLIRQIATNDYSHDEKVQYKLLF